MMPDPSWLDEVEATFQRLADATVDKGLRHGYHDALEAIRAEIRPAVERVKVSGEDEGLPDSR